MEIFRFAILPMEEIERREAFKEAINNCPHCGTAMEFQVEIDFLLNHLTEECHCPHCTIKVRSEIHSLQ